MKTLDLSADLPSLADEDGFRNRGLATTRTESFTDAAFAFALTLLVISTGSLPDTMEEFGLALRRIPAFAASFALLAMFWSTHTRWSRRYGLDDGTSRILSLGLVFTVLVFVYPLRMVSASFFAAFSGGWFPSEILLRSGADLQYVFAVYSTGYLALSLFVVLLHLHASRRADRLRLDAFERHETRWAVISWSVQAATAVVSLALATMRDPSSSASFLGASLPGFAYATLGITMPLCAMLPAKTRARLLALRT